MLYVTLLCERSAKQTRPVVPTRMSLQPQGAVTLLARAPRDVMRGRADDVTQRPRRSSLAVHVNNTRRHALAA
ncbi:unnamed protein product [Pieris brassicae]|uniref:Uncharacterized protein n=1 Tax=Pieris brassicae TaxID=7116 RepID=A0A9P0SIC6_PIEBR|nr:unnamed protein product [Pieris brassicae]